MAYRVNYSTVKDGNMSLKYGAYDEVLKNKKKFFDENNIKKTVSINVLYSDKINFLNNSCPQEIDTDCLITNQKNIFLYLCFGDCIPMVVYDKTKEIISLTHLGWQSISLNLHQKVIQYYIDKFNSNLDDLEVVLGPSIKKDSYILKKPNQLQINGWERYLEKLDNDYYKIDLNKFVCDSLLKMNIKQIINSEIDTAQDLNLFSHYRYNYMDKNIPEGRFIFGVMLDDNANILENK